MVLVCVLLENDDFCPVIADSSCGSAAIHILEVTTFDGSFVAVLATIGLDPRVAEFVDVSAAVWLSVD